MLASISRQELSDAVTIIGACSLVGGIVAWTVANLLSLVRGQRVDVERWVVQGGGSGGLLGILLAALYLLFL